MKQECMQMDLRDLCRSKRSAGVSGRERKKCQMDQKANEYVTAGTTGKGGSKSGCGRCIHGRNFGGSEKNTQLVLKMRGESYPVRDCAIRTILSRAGVNGDGLRKLDKATYAKVVNYCLRVAKGDALIKIADGKVSAVQAGINMIIASLI